MHLRRPIAVLFLGALAIEGSPEPACCRAQAAWAQGAAVITLKPVAPPRK